MNDDDDEHQDHQRKNVPKKAKKISIAPRKKLVFFSSLSLSLSVYVINIYTHVVTLNK